MVINKSFRALIMFSVPVLLLILLVSSVKAQQEVESVTLSVSPTVVELDANPGEVQKGSFKIINGSDTALNLTTTPKNFTASDEVGGVDITEEETSYSLASWVSVTPEKVNLDPRGSQIFNYTISIPDNAEPGGHFGSIIVKTNNLRVDETGPSVSQEVGPLILVRIAGDTYQEASIVEFKSTKSLLEKGPVTFETRIENTGNVHFKPKGTIEIKNMFGQVVTTLDLEEKNVLPDSIRKLTNDWNPSGFKVGRYTANLTVVYGVDNKIVTESTSFILFPYKTMVPIILVLGLVVYLSVKNRKRLRRAIKILKNG